MQTQTWSSARIAPPWPTPSAPRRGVRPVLTLNYAAGAPVYVEGDPVHSLYIVVSGAVRTVRHSIDGRRQIGGFYYPGDLFGLDAGETHAFSAEALCPSDIMVHQHGADDLGPRDGQAAMTAAMEELRRTQHHLAMLGRRSACEKVASFLVDMARLGGSDVASLPMSRQDMADYLGLAMETVSRVLGQFQAQGLVVFASGRDFHIVRGAALSRLAAS